MTRGVLYGVGVGPGDPELLTLKAARVIAACPVLAYPTLEGAESFARRICADVVASESIELAISVPMTVARAPAQAAYDAAAIQIASHLEAGQDVAVLCEGDPFFYGSFMYLFARLSERFETDVIPGITSVTACAARAGLPLAARNERVTILPGPLPEDELEHRIAGAESVVIMKVGRHLDKIRRVMARLGVLEAATYVERATLPEERILPLAAAPDRAPYFSMILLTKGADPWL